LKVIWVSSKVRAVYSNLEENFLLNACVRCENIVATPDPNFAEFSFAQGLVKVKLRGVC
jgi:hypothetical protein